MTRCHFLSVPSPLRPRLPARPRPAMPRLAFQLTCSRWVAQWEDTGKGRCVYFPETKCCAVADGSALEQVAAFDTTATQPERLDRQSWLTLGDGETGEKNKIEDVNQFLDFWCSSFLLVGSSFLLPQLPQSASQLAGLSLWVRS